MIVVLEKGESQTTAKVSEEGALPQDKAITGLESAGIEVTGRIASDDATLTVVARPTGAASLDAALESARNTPGVVSAQPNYIYRLIEPVDYPSSASILSEQATGTPTLASSLLPVNDAFTRAGNSTSVRNQYWAFATDLVGTWREAKSDNKVTIAILDSGVNLDHEDLAQNILGDLAWNSATQSALERPGDTSGHGTHVAGIAAGVANNALGISGASNNANILPVKVLKTVVDGDGKTSSYATTATLIAAYDYLFKLIDDGTCDTIRVVNISLGGDDESGINDQELEDTIAKARNAYGITTVCSGGNDGKTGGNYPSDFAECIAVTALTSDGKTAYYSDHNAAKDISAPGSGIWSSWIGGTSEYVSKNGTSMASPIVAGTVALMYAVNPSITPDEVEEALYGTATPVADQPADSGSHGALQAQSAVDKVVDSLAATSFPDVQEGSWYKGSVDYATRRGIMHGFTDGSFYPDADITREQAAVVLYNYLGNEEVAPATSLSDVSQDLYYSHAVNWAVAHRVMSGYSGTDRFGVGDPLTREQLAVVFANILATPEELDSVDTSNLDGKADAQSVSGWAMTSVAWALNKGVINGVDQQGERWIMPDGHASRSVMAAVTANSIQSGLV